VVLCHERARKTQHFNTFIYAITARPYLTNRDVYSNSAWDGFCGTRRRSARRHRQDSSAAAAAYTDGVVPFSLETHFAGLAWGAGLELRDSLQDKITVYLPSAAGHSEAPQQTSLGPARKESENQHAVDAHALTSGVADVSVDPYAWRNGAVKGEVRLLSDLQLLDFEGSLSSFPLGGNRQRFDLSSLKERWNERVPPQEDTQHARKDVHHALEDEQNAREAQHMPTTTLPTPTITKADASSGRVSPLASLKRRYDEEPRERDPRAASAPSPRVPGNR